MLPANVKITHESIPCPFCGLACDDLKIQAAAEHLEVVENGCERAEQFFELPIGAGTPRVRGEPASLEEAVAEAARLLKGAHQPVIGGLATDVAGVRAALALGDRIGAVVDHMNADATLRNVLAVQDSGWITTTLSEVRNRADLIVMIGGAAEAFPRFLERCVQVPESKIGLNMSERKLVCLGTPKRCLPVEAAGATVIACPTARVGEVAAVLSCLVNGRTLQADQVAGVPMETLQALAGQLKAARYGVIVWAAGDLAEPHGELAVQSLCRLVSDLNVFTRFAGLPLGGTLGDLTANQVAAWQTGYPMRTSFAAGYPQYDPYHHAARRLLARRAADCLVWISSFGADAEVPATGAPTIVLARAGRRLPSATVYIPVGTPGIDHAGHFFRCDGVVSLPLRQLRKTPLPATHEVLAAISRALED